MLSINFYKKFYKDLENLTNNELIEHWEKKGIYEGRLPNLFEFKLYNSKKIKKNNLLQIKNDNLSQITNYTLSIIIIYNNKKKQIVNVLNIFQNLYKDKNIEIIILDTGSNKEQNLDDILKNYTITIKYFTDQNTTEPLNFCISQCSSDNILFQYSSCVHKCDIIEEIQTKLLTNQIIGIREKITNNKICETFLTKIKQYKPFDMIAFNKIIYNLIKFELINVDYLQSLQNIKYDIIETSDIEYIFPKKIPKIIHFYWDNSKFCYLTQLAFDTVVFHNPNWEIKLYMPKYPYQETNIWESQENIPPHSIKYDGHDYFDVDYLKSIGINIIDYDYYDIGLNENTCEVTKSDIFRYKILYEQGGVWADTDILFNNVMEKTNYEKYTCEIDDIETIISQYSRMLDNNTINFYYIGLMMGSIGNNFFKIMYETALKKIDTTKYQGVGGDLMKEIFGWYDDIKLKIGNVYANLESNSIYKYWWGDLKNMFLNKYEQNVFQRDYFYNDSIIGYHWFRGVHLSKICSLFIDYQQPIHNFNMNGILIDYVKYYRNIFKNNIFNTQQHKISIVMGYINRLPQLENTIITISKSKHKNFEIIIVNDGIENLEYLKTMYENINIKIINNMDDKSINPCMTYNKGIDMATGEYIILQNPECCHVGDILSIVNCLLTQNSYLAFNCFYLDNYEKNKIFGNILFDEKYDSNFWHEQKIKNILHFTNVTQIDALPKNTMGWSSHYKFNRTFLHFCVATTKNVLTKIGGFPEQYKNGVCFDDDAFVRKIKFNNVQMSYFCTAIYPYEYPSLANFAGFVVHQHHDKFEYNDKNIIEKWNKNKNLFITEHKLDLMNYLEIKYQNKNLLNGELIYKKEKNKYIIYFANNINPKIKKYECNGKTIIFRENIVFLINNCINSLSFNANINNIELYTGTEIIKLNSNNNIFSYIGYFDIEKMYLIYDNKIIIKNLIFKIDTIINRNTGIYIENNNTWKFVNIPKILHVPFNKDIVVQTNNLILLNPDWIICVYYVKNKDDEIVFDSNIFIEENVDDIYILLKNIGGVVITSDIQITEPLLNMIIPENMKGTNIISGNYNDKLYMHIGNNIEYDNSVNNFYDIKKLF